MRQSTLILVFIVIIIIAIGFVLIFDIGRQPPEPYMAIASFDDCTQAGYPILETSPRQCKTPDGRTFTEEASSTSPTNPEPSQTDIATSTPTSTSTVPVVVTSPTKNIVSPATITGKMVGNWFFEAQSGIDVRDASGTILGVGQVKAQADWTTTNYVPFEAKVTFTLPGTATGTLVFHKDNPSGDPARDQSFSIPVTFKH